MTIIVTGGAGFIGSNFIFHMLGKYPDYRIICLDKLTYAGNLSTLAPVMNHPNFRFVKADICDRDAVFALFDRSRMQTIGILLVNACMESAMIPVFGIPVSVQLFAVFDMVPIALYSGGKLSRSKTLQWAFYLFYPVHLLLLWIVLGFVR